MNQMLVTIEELNDTIQGLTLENT